MSLAFKVTGLHDIANHKLDVINRGLSTILIVVVFIDVKHRLVLLLKRGQHTRDIPVLLPENADKAKTVKPLNKNFNVKDEKSTMR